MTVAIDTNILLDILLPDPNFMDKSFNLLTKYIKTDQMIISDIVYSELASQFPDEKLLQSFLNDTGITLTALSPRALWISAKAWAKYNKMRNTALQCSHCGNKEIIRCTRCNSIITCRQHVISDFIIAGHAFVESGILLTRDRGFYASYFPELKTECG